MITGILLLTAYFSAVYLLTYFAVDVIFYIGSKIKSKIASWKQARKLKNDIRTILA